MDRYMVPLSGGFRLGETLQKEKPQNYNDMRYDFTSEEFVQILAYVNGENDDVLKTDLIQRFINLNAAFSAKLYSSYRTAKGQVQRVERANERIRARYDKEIRSNDQEGNYGQVNLTATEVAMCIVLLMKECGISYTRERVQFMMYEAYCSWLIRNRERLFKESPVAQRWGPHFWTVKDKITGTAPVTSGEEFHVIASQYSGIAVFLKNVVKKYAAISDDELRSMYMKSVPFKKAAPEKVDHDGNAIEGKWNREIKDSDIVGWIR